MGGSFVKFQWSFSRHPDLKKTNLSNTALRSLSILIFYANKTWTYFNLITHGTLKNPQNLVNAIY